MSTLDTLHTFLSLHLANDDTAAYHTPIILSGLHSQNVESSPNLSKWMNRINSLIHSRNSGARWSGLCLALETAKLSKNVMMGSGQTWATVVLPILSRPESLAVWKASMRLLCFVFTSTVDLSEFQRQVAIPNVPKFSSALISLAEKQADEELRVVCLDILAAIIPLYPTAHKQLYTPLSSLSLRLLDGSVFMTSSRLMISACRLYACLSLTGGKVGSSSLWRKSLDETIVYCGAALVALRSLEDSVTSASLHLDRLRCGVELIRFQICYQVARPVIVPVQTLLDLAMDILMFVGAEETINDIDPTIISLRSSITPRILELGCQLLSCISHCVRHKLAPHLTRIISVITYHLELLTSASCRLQFVRLLPILLQYCLPPYDPLLVGRILKALLPTVSSVLHQKPSEGSRLVAMDWGSKKGKKRARGYEGDGIFNIGPKFLCKDAEEGEMLIAVLEVLPITLQVPDLPAYIQSITARVLLSILLSLPYQPSSSISHDSCLKSRIIEKVESACIRFAVGSSSVMSQILPLVIDVVSNKEQPQTPEVRSMLDLMLHPRLPPLPRCLPSLDIIALSAAEESKDERETRENLALQVGTDGLSRNIEPQVASIIEHVAQSTTSTTTNYASLSVVSNNALIGNVLLGNHSSASGASTPATPGAILRRASDTEAESAPPRDIVSTAAGHGEQTSRSEALTKEALSTVSTFELPNVAMVVDEDDDGDIVVPPLNMDSDSDSDE